MSDAMDPIRRVGPSDRGRSTVVSNRDGDAGGEDGRGAAAMGALPEALRSLFWDCDFDRLQLRDSAEFIIGRVLVSGSWDHVRWLRKVVGDARLRRWILERDGRQLSRKQLRFWELVLKLPKTQVDLWLAATSREIWDDRACR